MVAEAIKRHNVGLSVIDPVMISTSGSQLLPANAVKALCQELIPKATILTPNIPEARLLLQESGSQAKDLATLADLKALASDVHKLGSKYVLLKGGHVPLTSAKTIAQDGEQKEVVANVLYDGSSFEVIEEAFQDSKNTHGTGCSLACTSLGTRTVLN